MPYVKETTIDLVNTANNGNLPEYESQEQYSGPLLAPDYSEDMRTRWEKIQAGFVDDPRIAVEEADKLVATAIQKLSESFAEERAQIEQKWSKGKNVSTEDLRQGIRRYRTFFNRLLAV